ncbi:MAG: FtsQ-type POTRA domain-containing protein, partial [Clostridia bacterium]|nr:FtsQ-type POTRA domain-containing protein [Clostridia bacterium]
MSSKNSDKRPPSKGKGSADRNKHNSVKNNYNGKHPQKLPSAKNNNNPYSPASQYNNRKNKTANAADTLDRTKKKRPVKSPPPEKKFPKEADSQMYEQVSEADIEVETSRILDRNRRKSTPKEYIKLPAPAKEPMSEYRRKLKTILFYIVTLVVLLSICFVLSLTVFFKIDDILVEGETRYQADDIIASCMIEKGDNLLLCNTSAGEKNIVDQFPYIEKVKMDKKLFNKIIINVTEAVPTSIIESGG